MIWSKITKYNFIFWKVKFFLFIIIFISSITIITGKDSGFIIYFIPGILFPSILFQRKKIILGFSSFVVLLLIVVFFMADSFEPIIKLTPKELKAMLDSMYKDDNKPIKNVTPEPETIESEEEKVLEKNSSES